MDQHLRPCFRYICLHHKPLPGCTNTQSMPLGMITVSIQIRITFSEFSRIDRPPLTLQERKYRQQSNKAINTLQTLSLLTLPRLNVPRMQMWAPWPVVIPDAAANKASFIPSIVFKLSEARAFLLLRPPKTHCSWCDRALDKRTRSLPREWHCHRVKLLGSSVELHLDRFAARTVHLGVPSLAPFR